MSASVRSFPSTRSVLVVVAVIWAASALTGCTGATDEPRADEALIEGVKTEHFDDDPGWEGVNNHVVPDRVPTVTQDFGYDADAFGGKGGIGGNINRSVRPSYYAESIPVRTLDDRLSVSGTFSIRETRGGSGAFFGWFNAAQTPGSGRAVNSLGLHVTGEKSGGRLAVRLITGTNRSIGTHVTPFEKDYQPASLKNDGTLYSWRFAYEPEANDGAGQFRFSIMGEADPDEEFEGRTFTVDVPDGYKTEGARFDRFGLLNKMKPGRSLSVFFGLLERDGREIDLSSDPEWDASGNRATFEDAQQSGTHDFGFRPRTTNAGGERGEVGGRLWRGGTPAYYGDRIGPLTLDEPLEARGRLMLEVGAPDSTMYFGWFNSTTKGKPLTEGGNFLGVHVAGPTRVGHYLRPGYVTGAGSRGVADRAPRIVPGVVYEWSIAYDPSPRARGGGGEIRVSAGAESGTLLLNVKAKAEGATFDRFGLITAGRPGGQIVQVYLDDLTYTAEGVGRRSPDRSGATR